MWSLIILGLTFCNREQDSYTNKDLEEAFWHELITYYAYPERVKITQENYLDSIITNFQSEYYIAKHFARILSLIKDGHLHLYTPWGIMGNENYFAQFHSNSLDDNSQYFERYEIVSSSIRWGIIRNTSLIYMQIKTFEGDASLFDCIDSLSSLWMANYNGLIIDVRGNRGGWVANSLKVASFFVSSSQQIGEIRRCRNGKEGLYTDWKHVYINRLDNRVFIKPIVILMDRFTYSAAEWFVIAMANEKHVATVGDTTGGGISIPIIRELPNGWLLSIPNTQFIGKDGQDFQFVGIPPQKCVILSQANRDLNIDEPFEYAIEWLIKQTFKK